MSCGSDRPYFNLHTSLCQNCGDGEYSATLRQCTKGGQVQSIDPTLERLIMNILWLSEFCLYLIFLHYIYISSLEFVVYNQIDNQIMLEVLTGHEIVFYPVSSSDQKLKG